LRIVPSSPTSDTYQEQFIFKISSDIYGLHIKNLKLGDFTNTTLDPYVVSDVGAYTVKQAKYQNVYWSGGTFDGDFENETTEETFQLVDCRTTDYIRMKTILPFTLVYSIENMADNTSNINLKLGSQLTTDISAYMPWDLDLVGISYNTNATQGTITIVENSLSGSFSEAVAPATATYGSKRYAYGTHTYTKDGNFNPKVNTSGLGAATYEITVIFYLTIRLRDQDLVS